MVKAADTMDEAVKLMEVGYEYQAEVEGQKDVQEKEREVLDYSKTPFKTQEII